MTYTAEKLKLAVRTLAVHEGEIHDRLLQTYRDHIIHLDPLDLPQDLMPDLEEILFLYNRTDPTFSEGDRVVSSVRDLSQDEATGLADGITELCFALLARER